MTIDRGEDWIRHQDSAKYRYEQETPAEFQTLLPSGLMFAYA